MRKMICLAALVAMALPVFAHTGATGIVKERMDAMKEMREAIRALGMVEREMVPYDPDLVGRASAIILTHAPQISRLYPAGSFDAPSEALPLIDQEREAFNAIAVELEQAATVLSETRSMVDAQLAIRAVSNACSNCHQRYQDD